MNRIIESYNSAIIVHNALTNNFKEKLAKTGLESLKREVAIAREKEESFSPEWTKWKNDRTTLNYRLSELLDKKYAKQKELEDYTKTIFHTHQKRINEVLTFLGADFLITDLAGKADERANESYSDFHFLILERKIPLSSKQSDSPNFKNTLSEGDKSTLAFAFFIAALEQTSSLDQQIIIFDDPLSSLDETRREATARILMSLSPQIKQLCVFTHKKDFLLMLADKIADHNAIQILSDKKHGSRLNVFDVEHHNKGNYALMVDEMERYVEEDFGPTPDRIQGNIRKIFEVVLKTKYYRLLRDCSANCVNR